MHTTHADSPTHHAAPGTFARRGLLGRLGRRDRPSHRNALLVYLTVVVLHFAEHVVQLAQVRLLGIARPDAGGLLGEVFPELARNEVLHTLYNSWQLTGLIVLLPGVPKGRARTLWLAALAFQGWHWFEHALLQVQLASGIYLYGAIKQMSVLERFFPRVELHFGYNLLVFVPTLLAALILLHARRSAR